MSASEDVSPDVAILASGTVLPNALLAADQLREDGIAASVRTMPSVKPLDENALERSFECARLVVTWEEHALAGGFGSAVGEWLIDRAASRGVWPSATLLRIGIGDTFVKNIGTVDQVRAELGVDPAAVTRRIRDMLATVGTVS